MSTAEVVQSDKDLAQSDKDLVREALLRMPENASLEEISEEIAILAAIRRGEEDVKAGRVYPLEEARKRLASWISK